MREARSAWRVNDAVAYDAMRIRLNELTATMLTLAQGHPDGGESTRREVAELRRAALGVDGFDRAAVDAFAAHLANYPVQGSV